jgi:hypothetical protein
MAFTDVISQPPYRNPDEVATIVAAGGRFEDWESVFVQHRWTDAFARFRFTSAERESDPRSFDWHTLRLKPPTSVHV